MWPWFDDVTDFEICEFHKKNLDIFLQIKKSLITYQGLLHCKFCSGGNFKTAHIQYLKKI